MSVSLVLAIAVVVAVLIAFGSAATPPAPPQMIYVVVPEREPPASGCVSLFVIALIAVAAIMLFQH